MDRGNEPELRSRLVTLLAVAFVVIVVVALIWLVYQVVTWEQAYPV